MRWRRALGLEVVDTSDASTIGRVDGLVVDAARRRCTGVVVGAQVIDWDDCGGLGRDAVTVAGRDAVHGARDELEQAAVEGRSAPLGRPVLTEDGVALGRLVDVEVDARSGVVGRLYLSDDDLRGERLLGIGGHAVMVAIGRDAARGGQDLEDLTRDELYELARERDLEGRSTMTKRELVEALR